MDPWEPRMDPQLPAGLTCWAWCCGHERIWVPPARVNESHKRQHVELIRLLAQAAPAGRISLHGRDFRLEQAVSGARQMGY